MVLLWSGAGFGATGASVFLWWRRWRQGNGRALQLAAAALLILAGGAWTAGFGVEIGIALTLEVTALVGFAFILTRIEHRDDRVRAQRVVAPPPRAALPARLVGIACVLVAGPLALLAALGIALLVATRAPMAEETRLILAGLWVPAMWAAMIGWVACDRRLPMQAAVLAAAAGLGFGASLLGRG